MPSEFVPNILPIGVHLNSIYWLPFASKACPFRKSTILPGQKQTVSPQRVFAFSGVLDCLSTSDGLKCKGGTNGCILAHWKVIAIVFSLKKAVSHGY
jgi:hypothetical protein